MENKTAVEWLINVYEKQGQILEFQLEQAHKMEEQQIKDAFETAFIEAYKLPLERDFNTSGQYYDKTYPIKF